VYSISSQRIASQLIKILKSC